MNTVFTLEKLLLFTNNVVSETTSIRDRVNKIDDFLDAHNIADVRVFTNLDEFYLVLTQEVNDAKYRINTVNFISTRPAERSSRQEYYDALEKVIRGGNIPVERVAAIMNRDKCDWVMAEQVNKFEGCSSFSVACVKYDSPTSIPLMTIVVIDTKVFIGMYWGKNTKGHMKYNIRMESGKISKMGGWILPSKRAKASGWCKRRITP